jgi:hypothetical protein
MQIFLLVRKLLGSFRKSESANFCGVQAHKPQIRKFVKINPQISKCPWCSSIQIANQQIGKKKGSVSNTDPPLIFFYIPVSKVRIF